MENSKAVIMVVDDEEELRSLVARYLNRKGYNTVEAGSGEEAMKILGDGPVDLIVSDVRMDNGDGPFLLNQINQKYKDLPIIFISGFSDCETDDLLQNGAKAILTKPVDKAALLEGIKKIIAA